MRGVYVIAPLLDGPCKIGIAVDVEQRVAELQTGNWCKLHAAFFGLYCHPQMRSAGASLERAVHKMLRKCELEMHGEWFDVTVKEAIDVIQKVASRDGYKWVGIAQASEQSALTKASRAVSKAQTDMVNALFRNAQATAAGVKSLSEID